MLEVPYEMMTLDFWLMTLISFVVVRWLVKVLFGQDL